MFHHIICIQSAYNLHNICILSSIMGLQFQERVYLPKMILQELNKVDIETQGLRFRNTDQIKFQLLQKDLQDYHQIQPHLKQLQLIAAKILKEFHQHFEKKEKKNGLSYNLVKKIQTVKSKLYEISKLIQWQNMYFQSIVSSREVQKNNEQLFFKKTMKSYELQRLTLKEYILGMEKKVQNVEEIVKLDVQYETHEFTKFCKFLSIYRLDTFEKKSKYQNLINKQFLKNVQLKQKLKQKIQQIKSSWGNKQRQSKQSQQEKEKMKPEVSPMKNQNLLESPNSILDLLHFMRSEKMVKYNFMRSNLWQVRNRTANYQEQKKRFSQQLMILNEKIQSIKEQTNFQSLMAVSTDQLHPKATHFQKNKLLTRTDYYIYLKNMKKQLYNYLKEHAVNFQRFKYQQNLPSPNVRSMSASKYYHTSKSEFVQQECMRIKSLHFGDELANWKKFKSGIRMAPKQTFTQHP